MQWPIFSRKTYKEWMKMQIAPISATKMEHIVDSFISISFEDVGLDGILIHSQELADSDEVEVFCLQLYLFKFKVTSQLVQVPLNERLVRQELLVQQRHVKQLRAECDALKMVC